MVKEYIRSQDGVSREDMKKLAEAGDWKAALIIGSLGRVLGIQEDMRRAMKDILMKSSDRFKSSQMLLFYMCFPDLVSTLSFIKRNYKPGEELKVPVPGITGVILFRLNLLDDFKSSNSLLKKLLLFPKIAEVYSFLKSCNPEPRISCFSINEHILRKFGWSMDQWRTLSLSRRLVGVVADQWRTLSLSRRLILSLRRIIL